MAKMLLREHHGDQNDDMKALGKVLGKGAIEKGSAEAKSDWDLK